MLLKCCKLFFIQRSETNSAYLEMLTEVGGQATNWDEKKMRREGCCYDLVKDLRKRVVNFIFITESFNCKIGSKSPAETTLTMNLFFCYSQLNLHSDSRCMRFKSVARSFTYFFDNDIHGVLFN